MRLVWEEPALDGLARAAECYWPVPPLGVFYAVSGDELRVLQVVDVRRMLRRP